MKHRELIRGFRCFGDRGIPRGLRIQQSLEHFCIHLVPSEAQAFMLCSAASDWPVRRSGQLSRSRLIATSSSRCETSPCSANCLWRSTLSSAVATAIFAASTRW